MYRQIALLSLLFLSFTATAQTQKTPLPVYLNHVFFVLDSNSYAHVFDSAIFKKIGFEMVMKTTTTEDSWYGKYLMGRDSYFEVFYPTGLEGSSVGNFGLGFMTQTLGDINEMETVWKAERKDSIRRDTSVIDNKGFKLPWFYSLSYYSADSSKSGSAWVMENTGDMLKSVGFTNEEMNKPVLWHNFIEKKMKMKNSKSLNRIVAVEIVTNKKELDYFKESFIGFGLTEKQHVFSNENIRITYTLADIPTSKLKSVEIELTEPFAEQTVILSNNISMHVKDKTATIIFNNW